MKIVLTGGHHTSAIAVIEEFKSRNVNVELVFIGHKHSMGGDKNESAEYRDITELKIPFYDIGAGKFYRVYNPFKLLKIVSGFIKAFFLLARLKPDCILSFGGFIAVPVVISGWVLRIPSVTHEQTVVSGIANRVIAPFVKKILVSWKSSLSRFPANKAVLTGLPLRNEIFTSTSSRFKFEEQLPVVYITGGKQGSHLINDSLRNVLEDVLEVANIVHQTGSNSVFNDFEVFTKLRNSLPAPLASRYAVVDYIQTENIGEVLNKASLVVCRSGAHTIAELLALKKPALLIPISWVSHNEQYLNAKVLVDAGLGRILDEKELEPLKFKTEILEMLKELRNYYLKDETYRYIKETSAKIIVDETLKVCSSGK